MALMGKNENYLMERVLFYAKRQNYVKYTSTIAEAWRISIAGLSDTFSSGLKKYDKPPELEPDEDYRTDPLASFGILEAQRHRARGVNLTMFLGLMKYYRQSYIDLILESDFSEEEKEFSRLFIDRCFDRIEIGFCTEWSEQGENEKLKELQDANRIITNEKNKYLTIFESLHDPAIFIDRDKKVVNINHSATELLKESGISDERYYNPKIEQNILSYISDEIEQLFNNGYEKMTFEKQMFGYYFQVELKKMLDVSGKFSGVIITLDDVTLRRNSEDELNLLGTAIEQSGECIVITNENGIIQYVNPAFEEISGYSQEEVLGKNMNIVKSGKHDNAFYKELWDTIKEGRKWNGRFINKKKDGSLYEEESSISPVRDGAGNITNYVVVKRDITDQIKLEEQIRQVQKMEAIGTLAGGIAHDFNNILGGIMGYTELAYYDMSEDSPVRYDLEQVLKAAGRAKELIRQILTFTRNSENKKSILNIGPVVKEVIKLLRATIPSTIEIRQNLCDGGASVFADATQIHQVLMNLCANAFHSMKAKGGILKIGLETVEIMPQLSSELPPGYYVLLTVSDTGHGMSREVMDRIFEPYFTTKKKDEGTGMGLAVVHGIVKDHGGGIKVFSEEGRGTTFSIYLPEVKGYIEENIIPEEEFVSGNETILFVDDEKNLVEIGGVLLKKLGYNVLTTSDSIEALKIIYSEPDKFDLVITDQLMPGITGIQLAAEISKIRPELPVILCTGFPNIVNEPGFRDKGIKEIIIKPFFSKNISKTIRKVLKERTKKVEKSV